MGRIIRIVFFAVFFILIFLALAGIYEGCNKNKNLANEERIASVDKSSSVEEELNSMAEEFFEEESNNSNQDPSLNDVENNTPSEQNASLEDELFKTPESKTTSNTPTPLKTKTIGTSGGKYVVIAGNYINRPNAEAMVARLKKMGYSNADYFVFDGSKYFTVSADKLGSMPEAKNVSGDLKQRGIDSYVHTRQN